ncbi:MAG: hypothetical protein ABIG71_02740 [Candidatus Uhrbacteria bacterium]
MTKTVYLLARLNITGPVPVVSEVLISWNHPAEMIEVSRGSFYVIVWSIDSKDAPDAFDRLRRIVFERNDLAWARPYLEEEGEVPEVVALRHRCLSSTAKHLVAVARSFLECVNL